MARLSIDENTFALLTSVFLGVLATIFTIVAVATDGWPGDVQLFKYKHTDWTAAGVLLILSILLLALAVVFILMLWRGIISNSTDVVKNLVLGFLIIAAIFIVIAYSRFSSSKLYSLQLAVTAGLFTFLSAVIFSFWLGRTSLMQSR